MTDSNQTPPQQDDVREAQEALPSYTPRFEGFNLEVANRILAYINLEVARDRGEFQYRFADLYMNRAHLRFAVGYPVKDILDDFWMASRIFVVEHQKHLERYPHESFRTRRMMPVEIGVIGGEVDMAKRIAATYGLPLVTAKAGLGALELQTEMNVVSPGLLGGPVIHPQHLMGLAAGVYAAALSSTVRGYADEVKYALQILAQADYNGELNPGHKAVMLRYGGLCEVILELVQPGQRNLPAILADQAHRYTLQLQSSLGDQFLNPTSPHRYVDTSVLALIGLAQLIGYPLHSFPPNPEDTPHAVGYADFISALAEPRIVEEDPEVRAQINAIIQGTMTEAAEQINEMTQGQPQPPKDEE